MYEVYLAHHGILGQKWGVRRYQNPDGSLTAAGRKRYTIDSDGKIRKLSSSEQRAVAKADKKRAEALEKARKARAEKVEYNKQKAEAIKSGDASKVEKYFNDLTSAEMQDAMSQINTKQNFQRMLNQEAQLVSSGKTKTDQLMDNVGKLSDYADKGIRMYNIIAKVNNAFNSDTYMPSIGGEWAGDRKKKLDAERKAEAKKEKEDKERDTVEKLVRTADEYTLLKNRDKLNAKDWGNVAVRFNTEDKLLNRMAQKKIGEIQLRQKQHELAAEDYAELAKDIPTAYKIRSDTLKNYANYTISSLDSSLKTQVELGKETVRFNTAMASAYRQKAVNDLKTSRISKEAFDKVKDQYTESEQDEIRKARAARGWN